MFHSQSHNYCFKHERIKIITPSHFHSNPKALSHFKRAATVQDVKSWDQQSAQHSAYKHPLMTRKKTNNFFCCSMLHMVHITGVREFRNFSIVHRELCIFSDDICFYFIHVHFTLHIVRMVFVAWTYHYWKINKLYNSQQRGPVQHMCASMGR